MLHETRTVPIAYSLRLSFMISSLRVSLGIESLDERREGRLSTRNG